MAQETSAYVLIALFAAAPFNFAREEEKILAYWDRIDAFQTSLKLNADKPVFSFFDGPPFATGLPHYGHLLAGTMKDIVTRYAHNTGHHVERRFGFDSHGLPVEYEIDKVLNIKSRDDVMAMGIAKYNSECRAIVLRYAKEWESTVNRMGRWIDFKNGYITLDLSFMESVWWVFQTLFDKQQVYRGYRVMPYSTGCKTPLANFEVNLNYQDVSDPSVVVSFPLVDEPNTAFLAWTTTPWTLPSNLALCVHPKFEYVKIKDTETGACYILLEKRLDSLYKDVKKAKFTVEAKMLGADLKDKEYQPLFRFFEAEFKPRNAFRVLVDDYVTDDTGTGIVHQAPAFGEDDYRVCMANGIVSEDMQPPCPVDENGVFVAPVTDFAGQYFKDADKTIQKALKQNGRLIRQATLVHSYPHCFSPDTRVLMYDGSVRAIADINVGDQLWGDDGQPRTVTDTIPLQSGQMYAVEQTNGETYYVNGLHMLVCKASTSMHFLADGSGELRRIQYWRRCEAGSCATNCGGMRRTSCTFPTSAEAEAAMANPVEMLPGFVANGTVFELTVHQWLGLCTPSARTRLRGFRVPSPVNVKDSVLPVEPHYLGAAWLGDGDSDDVTIAGLAKNRKQMTVMAPNAAFKNKFLSTITVTETDERTEFCGVTVDGNRRFLLADCTVVHNCWRSDTPIMYRAIPSWFVRVADVRDKLTANNNNTYWVPSFVKEKRFHNWLANAKDWNVSRSRYWGTPIPLWVSDDYEEVVCIGSVAQLEELSGVKGITDLHRESIDHITIPSKKGKGVLRRVEDVFDCWFESGSMPYAQSHYPFENAEKFKRSFPADFIAEGIDQTRGWFYTLTVLGTHLFGTSPFKNVIVNGLVLAGDGRKMSKRLKNYPEPTLVLDQYGADALRLYLINSPVVRGDNLEFKEEGVKEVVSKVLLPWYNAFKFLTQQIALLKESHNVRFEYQPDRVGTKGGSMDTWILASCQSLIAFVRQEMEGYRLYTVVPRLLKFINDLTNMYVRYNRRRLKCGDGVEEGVSAVNCLFDVIFTLCKVMAPFTPFLTETMYQTLKQYLPESARNAPEGESIHFLPFPQERKEFFDDVLERQVARMQAVIDLGRACRDKKLISFKTPLMELVVVHPDQEYLDDVRSLERYVLEELNVRKLTLTSDEDKHQVQYRAEADFKVLGIKLRKDMPKVKAGLTKVTSAQVKEFARTKSLTVEGITLGEDDLKVIRYFAGADGTWEPASDKEVLVLLEIKRYPELEDEGLAREVINRVQRLRKKAGLEPTDVVDYLYTILSDAQENQLERIFASQAAYLTKSLQRAVQAGKKASDDKAVVAAEEQEVNGSRFVLKRTPFGAFGGKLKDFSATELGGIASKAALAELPAGVQVDSVIFGNVAQTSEEMQPDAAYLARHVGHRAGLPVHVPALTVNRLCGSGFQSIINGAQEIQLGEAKVVLTGGTESMSQSPYAVRNVRWGTRYGVDIKMEDTLAAALVDSYPTKVPMGITAENLAKQYNISRRDCDEYALLTQQRWAESDKAGVFDAELTPVAVKGRKGVEQFTKDEHPRPQTTIDTLAKLPSVFIKDVGTVTAGNASGICDGAAALVVAGEEAVKQHNLKPLARIVSWNYVGVEPTIMGIGPVPAIKEALRRANLTLADMSLVEVNQAFAAQYLAVEKELGFDRSKTNVNSGAIALGHPLAASGARIMGHLAHQLKATGGRYAVGSACIGGGQGIAIVIENVQ
ncbi:isoleucine--tRNA ligase [Sorochytrium milnesiophthora]